MKLIIKKIRGIEYYTMPSAEREFALLEDDKESGSESEFAEVDTDYSNDFDRMWLWTRIRLNVQMFTLLLIFIPISK